VKKSTQPGGHVLVSRGTREKLSDNETKEILTVYLRKRTAYILVTRINDFGSPEVLEVRLGDWA